MRVAVTGPAASPTAEVVANTTGALTAAMLGSAFLRSAVALAATDRRVFFVAEPPARRLRVEPKEAVRVLEYDTTASSIRIWLNVDGHQIGYQVPHRLRPAADALVAALGGAPPSLTRTGDH